MMKVYDMVTYGMHDPDDNAPPYGYESVTAAHAVPALQLQMLQHTPTTPTHSMPASLRDMDIDRFLDGIGN